MTLPVLLSKLIAVRRAAGHEPIGGGYTRLEFSIPSRGLIGYRGEFMTDTRKWYLKHQLDGYAPFKGELSYRKQGILIAFEASSPSPTVCSMPRSAEPVHRTRR